MPETIVGLVLILGVLIYSELSNIAGHLKKIANRLEGDGTSNN